MYYSEGFIVGNGNNSNKDIKCLRKSNLFISKYIFYDYKYSSSISTIKTKKFYLSLL